VQLYEPFTDSEGNLSSRPVVRDGQPVECREAVRRRDALIEHLASLPPVPGALDQIVQRFGTDLVAEVTGRSRRIVRKGEGNAARLVVESRAGSANLSETAAFMDDQKRILIFSDAGGTGRSYHADLGAKNQRLRVHYLLEPGWKADAAIQGLGRTNRTNQAQPPLFRPVATDVKAEKRFLSTIARRLDTLGAITRGQRQTGGQGLFRPEDNLESSYARDALRQLFRKLYRGDVPGCSLMAFQDATGLSLTDDNGLKDDLPPITTFLNRLLALTIHMQGILFTAFEELLAQRIEGAIAAGVYDLGLETLRAESFRVTDARVVYTHPGSGAETQLLTIAEKGTVQLSGVHNLSNRVLLTANRCSGETECVGKSVLKGPMRSLADNVANLKSRRTSRIWPTAALACRLMTAKRFWHRFNGTSSSSRAPSIFCFDVIARDAAEPGRSRITRAERYRRFTALSPCQALGCTHADTASPASTSQSPLFPSSAQIGQRPN
jgi:hypothetical protein